MVFFLFYMCVTTFCIIAISSMSDFMNNEIFAFVWEMGKRCDAPHRHQDTVKDEFVDFILTQTKAHYGQYGDHFHFHFEWNGNGLHGTSSGFV